MCGLVDYPFPLRPDCLAHIRLPGDVTAEEIERVVKMMRLLPREETSREQVEHKG